jgi:hypothetical protein
MRLVENRNLTILLALALFIGVSPSKASLLETTNNKALFQLQPYKEETTATYQDNIFISSSLINLNTNINSWYILDLVDKNSVETTYNILPVSDDLKLRLNPDTPELLIQEQTNNIYRCDIYNEISRVFETRKRTGFSHLPVCNNLLLVVIKQDGFRPMIEKGAEALRWLAGDAAEDVINAAKYSIFNDRYLIQEQTGESAEILVETDNNNSLPRAAIEARYQHTTIPTRHLGLVTEKSEKSLLAGQWYPLQNYPAVYASLIMPGMVSREIQSTHRDRVNRLGSGEKKAVVYLMSFSLGKYTLGWGHGTDHPGVGWSSRAVNIIKDNPYGPDGFDRMDPLITLGNVPPFHWSETIGTFSGGFQKRHSAFRYGELSKENKAHHYGFMQNGVMLSSPTEGLATVVIYKHGSVELKRWTAQDNDKLPRIRHIRQNGVPLIHRDETGHGIPGKYVKHWSRGNWSGTADRQLKAPRGAACIIETPQDNYMVYAYFSGATPSAMARVFQAYGCNFAIQLDLNSPGQAYASLFRTRGNGSSLDIELLVTNMHMYMGGNRATPRYFIKPDYKDFFYIMKKE